MIRLERTQEKSQLAPNARGGMQSPCGFVSSSSVTRIDSRFENATAQKQTAAHKAPPLSFIEPAQSVRGEAGGILLDHAVDRGLHGLRRLVPFDRLELAHQRAGQHLVHAAHWNDLQVLLDRV